MTNSRTISRVILEDHHRPGYHFLPEKNWMNDPNGLIQWKGQYHMFYQYNPNGPFHGTIHWGHAVSSDLVHWEDLPIALTPTPGGHDEDGCFSGCAVNHNGTPTLIYTGVNPQTVCQVTSSDDLLTWQYYPGNPVIAEPPPGISEHAGGNFRDPYVWKEGETWYMVIGSKIEGRGGLVLLYRSFDLYHWDFLRVLMAGDIHRQKPFWTGTMWECPNLFSLNEKHVLIISIQATPTDLMFPVYYVGDFREEHFTPKFENKLIHGKCFYAPQVMHAEDERVVMFGWIKESRRTIASLEAGWSGVMSLPIQLSLRSDLRLGIEPVKELQALRQEYKIYNPDMCLQETLELIRGDQLEILAEFEVSSDAEFAFHVLSSPHGEEYTRIAYQADRERLFIDPSESSLSTVVDRDIQKAPLTLDENNRLRLHIFVDHSVLEVFANDHVCMASRVYPKRKDSQKINLIIHKGEVTIISLKVWKLASIWN